MTLRFLASIAAMGLLASQAFGGKPVDTVGDVGLSGQASSSASVDDVGYGPQSPRDLRKVEGENMRVSSPAPPYTKMNLCNIHFHAGAEHAGGEFTTFLGKGDGKGFGTGFGYDGTLSEAEKTPLAQPIGEGEKGLLQAGDTIEVHYVYSSADVAPGSGLVSCLNDETLNPQLRVETQVMVVVNDENALDFGTLTEVGNVAGYWQAVNLPNDTGAPIAYLGSTTGPDFNEINASPFQVTWSVRPKVKKVSILSVQNWYRDNIFDENYAHGAREIVTNPKLLSPIMR